MRQYLQMFEMVKNLDIVKYGIDRSGLTIEWYKDEGTDEVEELHLQPMVAANLMVDAELVDRVEVVDGQPVLYFTTVSDWSNYAGEHEQHVQKHQMTWADYCELFPLNISYARHLLMTALYFKTV